ncbi:MAG: alpha-galactosidase [Bacteroidales bacterium]|nr:alpha-galactosidase [Bacteroidales bacterium]
MKHITILAAALLVAVMPAEARKAKKFTHQTVEIPAVEPQSIVIETAGSQLVLAVTTDRNLVLRHYGAPVKDAGQFTHMDTGRGNGAQAYPAAGGTFLGQAALHVKYADGNHNTELRYLSHSVKASGGVKTTEIVLKDYVTDLQVKLVYDAYRKENVICSHSEIVNGGKKAVELLEVASSSLTLEADKYLLTHFHGGWAYEMQTARELLDFGTKVIESRRGTQTTQTENPSFLVSLNTGEFSETSGEVVAGALAWSGNFRLSFEKDETGLVNVLGGISPFASAYPLKAGETFVTPEMIWTWSADGAGGASRNLHRWARQYGIYGGGTVNPTLLNSWEGAYFTFTTPTLTGMIDDAAAMGLEMFVLDDGWFGTKYPRNSDKSSLGDWDLCTDKIPEGIDYLASYAHGKGLKLGIWIEPEMVSRVSELAEKHPEWVVQSPGRALYEARWQWVLDLANPEVQDFVFGIFDKTMQLAPGIDYIKWDCNRPVYSFGSPYLGTEQDRFFVEYVQGLYSVMRRIREKYPDVLVQCCSSGGSRLDYGAMRWCNEFWTSDNTDAISRSRIQYATSMIYPACAMASHVSAVPNHQSGNVTPLKMRFDMAAAGRLGMELQPKNLTAEERALAYRCIKSYKGFRDLVFTGDLYRISSPLDSDYYAFMYVSEDKSRAVMFEFCLRYQNRATGGHLLRLAGLDPSRKYLVTEQNVDTSCWWGNGQSFTGDFLMSGGFNPVLNGSNASAIFVLAAR